MPGSKLGAVAVTTDVEHVPGPYSVVAIVLCLGDVASNGLLELHRDWSVRGVQMGVAVVVCGVAYYWVFCRSFLRSLGGPAPHGGLTGWLASRPGWLMVAGFLALWLAALAVTAAAWALVLPPSGEVAALLAIGIVLLLQYWALATALLERRRQVQVAD